MTTLLSPPSYELGGPPNSTAEGDLILADHTANVADPLSQFGIRMIQEAMTAAVPHTWHRRAQTLEDARPRPDDFNGRATAEELAERDRRLADQAEGCRQKARFLTAYPDVLAEVIAADVEALMSGAEGVDRHGDLA